MRKFRSVVLHECFPRVANYSSPPARSREMSTCPLKLYSSSQILWTFFSRCCRRDDSSDASLFVGGGCLEENEVVAIVDVHDELLEGWVAEEAVDSVES